MHGSAGTARSVRWLALLSCVSSILSILSRSVEEGAGARGPMIEMAWLLLTYTTSVTSSELPLSIAAWDGSLPY